MNARLHVQHAVGPTALITSGWRPCSPKVPR